MLTWRPWAQSGPSRGSLRDLCWGGVACPPLPTAPRRPVCGQPGRRPHCGSFLEPPPAASRERPCEAWEGPGPPCHSRPPHPWLLASCPLPGQPASRPPPSATGVGPASGSGGASEPGRAGRGPQQPLGPSSSCGFLGPDLGWGLSLQSSPRAACGPQLLHGAVRWTELRVHGGG